MTRPLTEGAKKHKEWKNRKLVDPTDVDDKVKWLTVQFLYSSKGMEPQEIIKFTGPLLRTPMIWWDC